MIAGTTNGSSIFGLLILHFNYQGTNARLVFLDAFTIVMRIVVVFVILGFACTSAMTKRIEITEHEA
jgi:hypothetical protein